MSVADQLWVGWFLILVGGLTLLLSAGDGGPVTGGRITMRIVGGVLVGTPIVKLFVALLAA